MCMSLLLYSKANLSKKIQFSISLLRSPSSISTSVRTITPLPSTGLQSRRRRKRILSRTHTFAFTTLTNDMIQVGNIYQVSQDYCHFIEDHGDLLERSNEQTTFISISWFRSNISAIESGAGYFA